MSLSRDSPQLRRAPPPILPVAWERATAVPCCGLDAAENLSLYKYRAGAVYQQRPRSESSGDCRGKLGR